MVIVKVNDAYSREKGSDDGPPGPFRVPSYQELLHFPRISLPVIDAIVVPSNRPAEQLRFAIELATQARCQLLPLYADDFPPGLSEAIAGPEQDKVMPLALPGDLRDNGMLDLGAAVLANLVSPSALAISKKRNLALLIGRMCGWRRILFLDDDIFELSIDRLFAAARLLAKYPVVGFEVRWFPDSSVVGHSRRMLEYLQAPFVSGGCLLVDPQRFDGFFPPVYHDDWLSLIKPLRSREVAVGGMVKQIPYDPFSSSDRARHEEFGEILGSGLLWLLREHKEDRPASEIAEDGFWQQAAQPSFWAHILRQRAELLEMVAKLFQARHPHQLPPQRSLEAALQRCTELKPDEFVSVTKWLASSLAAWRKGLSALPRVDSVPEALDRLGLLGVVREYPGSTAAGRLGLALRPGEGWAVRSRTEQSA